MAATPEKVPLLIIEGNIGVGKSTLLRTMRDNDPLAGKEHCYIEEDIDPKLLEEFYSGELDKTAFQIAVLTHRFKKLVEAYTKGFKKIVIDRYIYGDQAFAMANIDGPIDFARYHSHWMKCKEHLERCFDITCMFMQAPSVEFLMENIKKRGRESEVVITPKYLSKIEKLTFQNVLTFCNGRVVYVRPDTASEK